MSESRKLLPRVSLMICLSSVVYIGFYCHKVLLMSGPTVFGSRRCSNETGENLVYARFLEDRRHKVTEQLNINKLKNLQKLSESGYNFTRPRVVIIVTTGRSGSSFLGELLATVPGAWYHYEPLMKWEFLQHKDLDRKITTFLLKELLKCDYSSETVITKYLDVTMSRHEDGMLQLNSEFFKACQLKGTNTHLCFDPQILRIACLSSPIQIVKTVRLPMRFVVDLLPDLAQHNVEIILLVRDPRAVISSRKATKWRAINTWENPKTLCDESMSNYKATEEIRGKVNVTILRYEDLAQNTQDQAKSLFAKLGLPFTERTGNFLETHTRDNRGGHLSTYRNPTSRINLWIKGSTWDEVEKIQSQCRNVLDVYNYTVFNKEEFELKKRS